VASFKTTPNCERDPNQLPLGTRKRGGLPSPFSRASGMTRGRVPKVFGWPNPLSVRDFSMRCACGGPSLDQIPIFFGRSKFLRRKKPGPDSIMSSTYEICWAQASLPIRANGTGAGPRPIRSRQARCVGSRRVTRPPQLAARPARSVAGFRQSAPRGGESRRIQRPNVPPVEKPTNACSAPDTDARKIREASALRRGVSLTRFLELGAWAMSSTRTVDWRRVFPRAGAVIRTRSKSKPGFFPRAPRLFGV